PTGSGGKGRGPSAICPGFGVSERSIAGGGALRTVHPVEGCVGGGESNAGGEANAGCVEPISAPATDRPSVATIVATLDLHTSAQRNGSRRMRRILPPAGLRRPVPPSP